MNGGLSVIGDLYKSTVFALCRWLESDAAGPCRSELALAQNNPREVPSAELRPDQKDSDSLPDYDRLDPLLIDLIEHRLSRSRCDQSNACSDGRNSNADRPLPC